MDVVMKRPAAKASKGRPCMPSNVMGTTVLYNGGKVNVSMAKEGYRVFKNQVDRVDKLFRWSHYASKGAAWSAALDWIDGK